MSWSQFLKMRWEVLTATDFFTVEVATWYGLVTYYALMVMELRIRRVEIAGITPHPPPPSRINAPVNSPITLTGCAGQTVSDP